jgi:5'-3' exonuclease
MKILFPVKPKQLEAMPLVAVADKDPAPLSPLIRGDMEIVIDVSWLSYRSAYAYWDLQDKGVHTGHVYGALMTLFTLYKEYSTQYNIQFVFALDGEPVWRKQQHPEYKAGRLKTLGYDPRTDVVTLFSFIPGKFIQNASEEADDLIAAYIKKESPNGKKFVIISADKDLWVLKDRFNVDVLGTKLLKVSSEHVLENFFTTRSVFVSLAKAIIGDDGDNLPKVMRFPRKDLSSIFDSMDYPSVDRMLAVAGILCDDGKITKRAYQLLLDNEAQIRKTYALASLREDTDYETVPSNPDKPELEKILTNINCTTLVPRLDTLFRGSL